MCSHCRRQARASCSLATGQRVTASDGWFCFLQAEDGIRDYKVTGVQTCALPISRLLLPSKKVTELCVTGWLLEVCVTVAVRVTPLLGALVNEGFRLEVTAAEVPAAAASVMVIVHPEPMDPGESPAKLSKI